jgi:hypothetical protein
MFFLKLIFLFGIIWAFELLLPDGASAWGPAVHTATALLTLENASQILPHIAHVITRHRFEFLYGCLAADFFLGKSQARAKPHAHNWQGGFRLLDEARDDHEAAYGYGFLAHLAADVAAHNFFVPSLISVPPRRRRRGHLYWEFRADYLVPADHRRIARQILSMDHMACDDLLSQVSGDKRNGLKTKKRIYTQTVKVSDYLYNNYGKFSDYFHRNYGKFSDYLYAVHPNLFAEKLMRRQNFHTYVEFMTNLSCRLVRDLLRNPNTSPCLLHDPMGKRNLRLARGKKLLPRVLRPRRAPHRFEVNRELLDL